MALPDMPSRLRSLLPASWFGSGAAPVRDAVLAALSAPASWAYGLYTFVLAQARLATSTGIFLDLFALDFFGKGVARRKGETDDNYAARIQAELIRPRNTRAAVSQAIQDLTGKAPTLIEPWNTGDCAALGYTFGVGVGAPLGSLSLTDQVFIVINPIPTPVWIDLVPGLPLLGFLSGATASGVVIRPAASRAWVEFIPGLPLLGASVTVATAGTPAPAPPDNAGVAGIGTSAGGVGVGALATISSSSLGSISRAEINASIARTLAAGIRAWVRIN